MTALVLCRQADSCLLSLSDAETNWLRTHHAAPRELSFVGGGSYKGWFDPAFIKRLSG